MPWTRHIRPADEFRARKIKQREQLENATSALIAAKARVAARKARRSIKAKLSARERERLDKWVKDLEWLAEHVAFEEEHNAKAAEEKEARENGLPYDPGPHRPYWAS